ncbi:MAG: PQQ-binding-like beta-propeller repeat protein [Pseudomonadaceae bacterium]|nr:PQQ-binding-like beta-propeller repeat protein [Pseudomonadaceae bacterium]
MGTAIKTPLAIALCLALLVACDGAEQPTVIGELAAQGVYNGAISEQFTIVGSLNHGISLWRNSDVERLYDWRHSDGEFAELVAGTIATDGSRAVTTDPRTLVLWNTETGAALQYWATPAAVLDVALLSDGRRALLGMKDHSALLFDAEDGSYLTTLLHEGAVVDVDVSDDDQLALTASEDETARLWRLPQGTPSFVLTHDNPVTVAALSPDARFAFTASQGRWFGLWDTSTGRKLHTFGERNTGATSAAFSKDNRRVAVGFVNREVRLYDTATGREIRHWRVRSANPWRNNGSAIVAVSFADNGNLLALTGGGRLLQLRST